MSFLYRPSPVVTLGGKTVGSDGVPLRGLPAGTMHGYSGNMDSARLNAIGRRTLAGDPWIVTSGTMGSFLGGDPTPPDIGTISAPPLDFGPMPQPVDPSSSLPPDFFSGAGASPIAPTPVFDNIPLAPDLGAPSFGPSGPFLPNLGPAAPGPPSGPFFPRITRATLQKDLAYGSGIAATIRNFFTSKVSPTPSSGGTPSPSTAPPAAVTPSWFQQSSLIPGTQNWMVAGGGLLALVLISSISSGKRR